MMDTRETYGPASTSERQQPSQLPSPSMSQDDGACNDHMPDPSESRNAYRVLNYTPAAARDSVNTTTYRSDFDMWDEILDIHQQSVEGRDESDDGASRRFSESEHGHTVIHRKLLQRRHVWKLQKQRSALVASRRAVATSPIHKRSTETPCSTASITPAIALGPSPCSFQTKRRLDHSPIRLRQSVTAPWRPGGPLTQSNAESHLNVSRGHCHQFSNASTNIQGQSNYPQISPVRNSKRRKLFSTSSTTDCRFFS